MTQPKMPRYKSKKELVYAHLRTAILHGAFQPDERIVIDGLASQLGVSQIPIREALQQLQAEGFVVMEPHVGPRVAPIEASLIYEVFQLLESLEVISGRAACQHMSDLQLQEMEGLLRHMDALRDDLEQWSQENVRLHYSLCDWGKTLLVKSLMAKVLDQWDRLRHYYLKDVLVKRIDLSQQDHWALYEALRARDPEQTECVARQHNQRAVADYVDYLRSNGQMKAQA
ncbi:hypothetical protein CSA56_14960 [candidate division KSB3 bacterium]|uniref:HTH gntR-type domain-containing protein n=1 Tax=candidate division KSB3 bacterium TaxID=2044937 RepID=A0A2G6KCA7_9BACT|nr:MAG: hypothetical protein CSA56_14960 [candidate division KSB3 bacterium]